jgi:chemotaxis receptor (MCP) glutamine deamidase CheD
VLLQAAGHHGMRLAEFEVRLYGGAHMFAGSTSATPDIGARHVARGRALLRKFGLAPLTVDGGGVFQRTILLDFASGAVQVRLGAASRETLGPSFNPAPRDPNPKGRR